MSEVFGVICALAIIVLVAVAIVFGVRDCQAQQRCEHLGGRVERYDCHEELIPMDCGSGCTMLVPVESCRWRCVGAPAEAR